MNCVRVRVCSQKCLISIAPPRKAKQHRPVTGPLNSLAHKNHNDFLNNMKGGEGDAGVALDHWYKAGHRLQTLLEEAEDESQEVRQSLLQLPVESRLIVFINLSSILLTTAIIINGLTDEDLLGGLSLSQTCLSHQMLGMGYSLPLIAMSLLSRMPWMHSMFPVLDGLHDCQETVLEPVVKDLEPPQMLIVSSVLTLSLLMLALPSTHGAVLTLGTFIGKAVLETIGIPVPDDITESLKILAPVMCSSYLSAYLVAKQISIKRGQFVALHSALNNSDRYFKFTESMALGKTISTSSNPPTGRNDLDALSGATSSAFKTVSVLWILNRVKVCRLAYVMTALTVCYITMTWYSTGDMWTPLACTIPWIGLEMALCKNSLAAKKPIKVRAL